MDQGTLTEWKNGKAGGGPTWEEGSDAQGIKEVRQVERLTLNWQMESKNEDASTWIQGRKLGSYPGYPGIKKDGTASRNEGRKDGDADATFKEIGQAASRSR